MNGIHQFLRRLIKTGVAAVGVALLCTGMTSALEADESSITSKPPEVGDFSLLDQNGHFRQLRRQNGARAVVLMVAGNGCPVVRQNAVKLQALRDKFRKVQFWMLDANPQDDVSSIVTEANEFDIRLPILRDESQMVAHSLGIKRTAEVIAISTKDWTVFYRGALDDQSVQGSVKAQVHETYLENALRNFLAGKPVSAPATATAGCLVHYDGAQDGPNDSVSYAKEVVPILASKCISCHSTGNIGPFAMSSHSKVRGFSDQIREELLTGRMPPWSADPRYGVFQGDRSLKPAELRTLVRWIDSGSPRGDGDDPLVEVAKAQPKSEEWVLGRPDYIVTPSQRMEIPATGVVDYITNIVDCPIPTDAWLRGTVVRPDNRKVLHHVIVYLEYPDGHVKTDRWEDKWLVGWAPGAKPSFYPEGTGKFIPKGSKLRFQLHYTPYGKADSDLTELGLYLLSQPPRVELQMRGVANGDFKIPQQAPDYRTMAILELPRATTIYELSPHMHKRGSWLRYEALYPDGRFETLLAVPRYNFNWQHTYRLAEPKQVPPGTRILCTGGFDNSKSNPDNPDANKEVRWGDQSFDEMFIGFMTVSESSQETGHSQDHARAGD